jgi:hypothetical protein
MPVSKTKYPGRFSRAFKEGLVFSSAAAGDNVPCYELFSNITFCSCFYIGHAIVQLFISNAYNHAI